MVADYVSPSPCRLGKSAISTFAEKLAQKVEFGLGADLEDLVGRLGGKIQYQDFWNLDSSESGSIVVFKESNFEITLAAHTSKERDRFTIAHELGHYFLHFRLPQSKGVAMGTLRAARYGGDAAEIEANWFAASFLMPEREYKEIFAAMNGSLLEVADKFSVSVSAATVRAKSLNLG